MKFTAYFRSIGPRSGDIPVKEIELNTIEDIINFTKLQGGDKLTVDTSGKTVDMWTDLNNDGKYVMLISKEA